MHASDARVNSISLMRVGVRVPLLLHLQAARDIRLRSHLVDKASKRRDASFSVRPHDWAFVVVARSCSIDQWKGRGYTKTHMSTTTIWVRGRMSKPITDALRLYFCRPFTNSRLRWIVWQLKGSFIDLWRFSPTRLTPTRPIRFIVTEITSMAVLLSERCW